MNIKIYLILMLMVFISIPSVFASGAIARRKEMMAQQQAVKQQMFAQQMRQGQVENIPAKVKPEEQVKEIVTIEQIWQELEITTEIWGIMMDVEPKIVTVEHFIDYYKRKGVFIRKPAIHYVELIDSMVGSQSDLIEMPFKDVLRFVAIIEYDFNNGQDRDRMALTTLGREGYEINKQRLGM